MKQVLLILTFLLTSFFTAIQSNAQCTVNVLQDDECNNNGVLEIIPSADFSSPYSLEVGLPNGSLFTTVFTEDTFLLTGLDGAYGGIYDVTITSGANTCSEQDTISETILSVSNFSPSFSFNGYNVSCYGSCDGEILVNIFSIGEHTFELYQDSVFGVPFDSTVGFNASFTELCAGEYFVLIRSSSGCEYVLPKTIREPDSLHVDEAITNILCNSQFDGDIQIDVSGGVGLKINSSTGYVIDTLDYTFSWTGPNGFTSTDEDITSLEAGDYNLLITDNNGCEYNEAYTVLEPLDSSNCITNNQDDCNVTILPNIVDPECPSDSMSITFSVVGGIAPYNCDMNGDADGDGSDDLVLSNVSISNSLGFSITLPTDENYELIVVDSLGCIQSYNFESEGIEPISVTPTINNVSCFGLSDGEIIINPFTDISGATAPYTISYGSSNPNPANLPSDDYVITITDATGVCSQSFSYFIDEPTDIELINSIVNNPNCVPNTNEADELGSIIAVASGGTPLSNGSYNYAWSFAGPATVDGQTLSDLGPGQYSVEVTDNNGCQKDSLFTLSNPNFINYIDVVSTDPSCSGNADGSFVISTSNADNETFSWFESGNPISIGNNDSISNLSSGVYSFTISNNQNCFIQSNFLTVVLTLIESDCDSLCSNNSDSLFSICDINNDAEYFVNELSCDGITTFNHSFLGDSSQIGLFNSGNSNIGIENGIIISTGDINGVTAGSFDGFLNNNVNDVDLLEVANSVPQLIDQDFQVTSINDVAILEFDFISDSSFVNLNFVFASSEYFGYENTAFNDAFGIFVSGPGISGQYSNESINIAEIESVQGNSLGESLPITISTVNEFYNSPFFINNQNDGINPVYINADGYTTTISANMNVIPNEEYHIKLAIGDASDAALNSYVFFGFGEFCSTNNIYGCTDVLASNYDSIATVDNNTCEYFVDCNFDFTFEFEIGNAGCYGANDGFIIIDTLSIEGGTPHYELVYTDVNNETVDPLNLQSGEYFLTITDDNGCQQSIFYFIEEEQPLSVNAEYSTQLTCDISEFSDILLGFIYTSPSGGNGPYTFDWFNNDDIILDPFYFNGDESSIDYLDAGQYTVVISDSLGCYISETFEIADIELVEYNGYSTTPPTNCGEEACNGSITVYSYNASNESLYLYNFQGIQLNANPIYTDSTITMYGLCEGEYYYLLQNNQSFCQLNSLNFTDIILTNESNCNECDFSFGQINSVNPYCFGSSDGQIYSTTPLQFGTPPYEVTLMNGNFIQSTYVTDDPQFYFVQLTSGFGYQVIITDSLGCTINEYFNLTEPEPIQLIQNNFNSNNESCFPGNDGQIGFQVVGGTPEYDITAFEENILFNGQNYSIQNLSSDWYSIFVIDANDCIADTIFYVDQTDLSVNLTTYDIYCSNALTDNDDLVLVDEGLVEVSLSPSLNLENVIIEITNLATQETFGTELDSFEVYSQNLVAGNYQLLAYLPNTNCFYSEEFNIVDYSLDVVISSVPSSSVFASDGSMSLNFLTSLFPYNVVITGPNNYFYETSTQNSQLDVFELSSGDYFISITDNENCVEEFEIFLNFVPMLIGCTDSTAINYNPNAEADDGSCDYCSLNLVSIENTTCQNDSGYIEVSSNSPYEYQLQILVDNEWVFYNDGGCFEFLNNGYGASWECLPADTFMIIGFGLNDCIDTLNSSIVNLTELIESEQLPMTQTPQLSDDVYSDVISIGFDFEFNGVEYNECLISSNNYLSFNTANANTYSPWNISNAIPSNISPLNTIMTPYQDLNPFLGGSIYYTTYGTAPNRVFIVRWKEVPMFSCSDELFSSTLYLYEGSNTIESHIEYKPICTEWNEGAAIHGIHNSDGTQADVVFDIFTNQFRNYPLLWTAVNDAFLFSPLDNGNGYEISTLEYGSHYNTDEYLTTTIAEEFGCTDPLALNYNQAAICDDNSCEYPIVFGCTDELAFNFNEDAEINDGSCCYQNPTTIVVNTGDDLSQTSWSLSDLEENELFSFGLSNYPENTDSARTDFFCLADGCYQINMNNWNGGSIEIYTFDEEILNVEPAIGSDITIIQFCLPIDLIGCMDSLACNFNPYANEDDGSCAYPQEVNQEFTFCDGFVLDGVLYNQSFMSTDTLISTSGCDSIVNNMYIINYSPEIEMFVDFFNNSLTAQTFNDDNSYQFSWNTGESTQTIGTDTNGIYSVTVTDSISLCSSTSSINVSWLDVSSINSDSEFVNDFKIYPNPSFDIFNIELNVQNFQEIGIRVVNSIGQEIHRERVEVEGNYTEQIDLSDYSKGIYNLTIKTSDGLSNHKLILQ